MGENEERTEREGSGGWIRGRSLQPRQHGHWSPEYHSTMSCYDRDQGFMLSGLLPQSILHTDGVDPVNAVLVMLSEEVDGKHICSQT